MPDLGHGRLTRLASEMLAGGLTFQELSVLCCPLRLLFSLEQGNNTQINIHNTENKISFLLIFFDHYYYTVFCNRQK